MSKNNKQPKWTTAQKIRHAHLNGTGTTLANHQIDELHKIVVNHAALLQRIAKLEYVLMKVDGVVGKAGDQFDFYRESHEKKNTPEADEKAQVNAAMADEMRNLLVELQAVLG